MGLFDILNGMSNGPRGQTTPAGRGGMSPITMGLLALLAYKAFKTAGPLGGASPAGGAAGRDGDVPSVPRSDTGGIFDWLRGSLAGSPAGGAPGSIITGGLGELVKRFQQNGYGQIADSWVGTGPNKSISASELEKAAGAETLDALARERGVPREQLVEDLRKELPDTVDTLTPDGRIPDEAEASRWV